jgi:hypothetical protein
MPHDFWVRITPLSRDVLVVCVYMRALFPQVSLTNRVMLVALLLLVSLSAVGNLPDPHNLCNASAFLVSLFLLPAASYYKNICFSFNVA